jgi:hypothetical protein
LSPLPVRTIRPRSAYEYPKNVELAASIRIADGELLFERNSRPSRYGSKKAPDPETVMSPSAATVIVPPIGLPFSLTAQVA